METESPLYEVHIITYSHPISISHRYGFSSASKLLRKRQRLGNHQLSTTQAWWLLCCLIFSFACSFITYLYIGDAGARLEIRLLV